MATFVLSDASVVVNSVDLSDHVQQVAIDTGVESHDDTAMGDDTRSAAGGLLTWGIEVTFLQDFASDKVDATLNGLVGSTTVVVVKPTSGAVSSTNPSWTGTALLTSYGPISGSVGDQAVAAASFASAGTLARATS